MAVTADQVEVVLRAQTAQYQTDLRAADKTFTQVAANATRSAAQVNAAASGLNTGNIAAQFQDIGVTAAMGMNPLIIALQQGTQLSAVMNQSMQAGVSPARALGAAFMQILNPISLGTIAIVALTAAAAQYFGGLIADGQVSNEELKEHDALIRSVAEKWGEAVPALQAYVDALDKASSEEDLGQAAAETRIRLFAELLPKVEELGLAFDIVRETTAASVEESNALDNAYDNLVERMADGTVGAGDLKAMIDLLSGSQVGSTETGKILIGILNQMTGAFNTAASAAANLANQTAAALGGSDAGDQYRDAQTAQFQYAAEQDRINGLTAEQLQLENEVKRVKSEYARANGDAVLGDKEALTIAQQRLAAEERRREVAAGEKAGTKASTATADEAKAVLELIAALEYEQSLLGMTAEQKSVANALREAGAAATDKQRERIEELILATMAEAEAIKASEAAMKKFQDMAANSITSFISDLRAGKSAAEALSNVFDNLADQLIQIAVKNLVAAAFGGGGGGFGNIFGALFGGGKAKGGPVNGGTTYLVGERGPELFTPSSAGNITPNHKMGGMGGGEVTVVVQAGEYFDARVAQVSGPVAAEIAAAGIASYDRNLPATMAEKNLRYGQ